jgi:Tfp pilus assembly protein PilZ
VVEHAGGSFRAIARNLGLGGIFIETRHELAYGTKISVLIQLPETMAPIRLPGLVRWQDSQGFGVQFLELGALATYALSIFTAAPR